MFCYEKISDLNFLYPVNGATFICTSGDQILEINKLIQPELFLDEYADLFSACMIITRCEIFKGKFYDWPMFRCEFDSEACMLMFKMMR